jgi:NAD(P)-dependent dehydrogenase (short-subunit alcohol dehydrogenase family)
MRESSYAGKVAIITGGASGIGAAIGRELARAGAEVVLADRQVELAERVAGEIRSSGGAARATEADVRSLSSLARVVEETVARLHSVDYFFNNAGIGVGGEVDTYELPDWDDVIDVNLRGVANGIQAVYPVMIRQGRGHIVNTGSVAGLLAAPSQVSYTATKHAVVGLSKALRLEAKRHGVSVSVICPGVIRTPILRGGKYGRMNVVGVSDESLLAMWERLRPLDVDVFARKAVQAVARNEAVIVIPRWWKAIWFFDRLSPSLSAKLWEKMLEKMRSEMVAAGGRPRPSEHQEGAAGLPREAAKGVVN